ncbi:NUDIX domain-containing protein [Micromonospora sp. CPCC 206060]|uniref:NAD(+) diphosphatase n=1 Tax=Micromonospora sp. CPCC 206060 TaxID=3122406 RepID=UPI002FF39ADD
MTTPAATARFVPGATAEPAPAGGDPVLLVADREVLVGPGGRLPRVADLPPGLRCLPLGRLDGRPVWVAEPTEAVVAGPAGSAASGAAEQANAVAAEQADAVAAEQANAVAAEQADALPDGRWRSWPSVAGELPEPLASLAGRALQVVTWRRTHRCCGACRAELADVPGETARRCPDCALYVPMQLSPAVLVAITRPGPTGGTELLLVRHSYGATGIWALVAGFVEAGEPLEAAARREVAEEVGLAIDRVTYFGSQPWAMSGPGVLLAGFTAVAADPLAEPVIDGQELVQARWFPVDALPAELPPAYSISRWLIDHVAALDGRQC